MMIKEFNERYMVVNEAGKAIIYEPAFDPILKRRFFIRISFEDFKKLYLNRRVTLNGKRVKAADIWLASPHRRQFIGGVVFDPSGRHARPDALNLWQGFTVEPRPGSWVKMQDHILKILCAGNRDHFDWLMGWMARLVGRPAEQGEVAVVLKGVEGAGKGILARALLHILAQHGLTISNSKHLTGNFNGHLRDLVFLFADEAFFAGDRAHVGVLKALITEPFLTVEAKHQNAIQMPNFIHLMMASNERWVVPAGLEARRFFVLEVSSERVDDHTYFAAIQNELDNGGYEAMLHDLLYYDLSGFNHRAAPKTAGLDEQKKLSLDTSKAWWMDVLHRGYVFRSKLGLEDYFGEWHDEMTTEVLFTSYEAYARDRRERHPMHRETFGKFMREFAGAKAKRLTDGVIGERVAHVKNLRGTTSRDTELTKKPRAQGYSVGELAVAREAFMTATGLSGDWPNDEAAPEGRPRNKNAPDKMPEF